MEIRTEIVLMGLLILFIFSLNFYMVKDEEVCTYYFNSSVVKMEREVTEEVYNATLCKDIQGTNYSIVSTCEPDEDGKIWMNYTGDRYPNNSWSYAKKICE